MDKTKVTHQINQLALEVLEKHPEGLRWAELHREIETIDPSFHPKTVNGLIWKLVDKYPDQVYKPERGVFRLLKFINNKKPE